MNNQYTYPVNSEVPTDDARRLIDEAFEGSGLVQEIQETEPRPYSYHKQLEGRIEQMRAGATEAHLPPKPAMARILNRFIAKPKSPLEDRLIEHESAIGGRLIPKHDLVATQRFWYYQGDWFLEQIEIDQTSYVSRYQISEIDAFKLYQGREVPFLDGELKNLLTAVELYHSEIIQNLYSK
jgi:hypothetical protein